MRLPISTFKRTPSVFTKKRPGTYLGEARAATVGEGADGGGRGADGDGRGADGGGRRKRVDSRGRLAVRRRVRARGLVPPRVCGGRGCGWSVWGGE
jgi:hypothetical protein